jgi:hypothetical protein
MQTATGHATAHRQMIAREPARPGGAGGEPLTPAERIALTMALLNHGLDLLHGLARTSLAPWQRGRYAGASTRSGIASLARPSHLDSASSRMPR